MGNRLPTPASTINHEDLMRLRIALLLLPAMLTAPLAAQEHHDHGQAPKIENGGVFPAGWSVRPDEGGKPTEVSLVNMAPGWHLVTATSGIMYRPQDQATGAYEVSSKIHLFAGGGGHTEAFGLFIGGKDLTGAGERYSYFLIRGDGTYKIKRRSGAAATDVTKDWTPAAAINKVKAEGSVANLLSVVVGKDKVSFRVNGQEVYSGPAAALDTDGIVGLRVNHNLSVHVESLELKE
jgi:hypothetical protein